uniref:Uncharacterized protein n=1 Tax=Glossina palpalis gambiensis TaxID=67801 RepID=A0A1B0B888_9MUSC
MERKGITRQLDKNSIKSKANKINIDLYNDDNAREILIGEQSSTGAMALPHRKLNNFFIYQSDIAYPANQAFYGEFPTFQEVYSDPEKSD